MANDPVHLIERAAERLRGAAHAAAPDRAGSDMPASPQAPVMSPPPTSAASHPAPPIFADPVKESLPPPVTMAALERAGMVVVGKRARPAEEYLITASNLLRTMPHEAVGANMVMITSTKPAEGKSFSAINLAASIAQNGLGEVLLLDADPKIGSITSLLGMTDRAGLFDYARGSLAAPEDAVVTTALPSLSFVPLGTNLALLSEKGITRPVTGAIERLGRRYRKHIVILDAPPCLSTSDASMLAPLVGHVLMVVEAERTQRASLNAALNLVKSCRSVTLLLNKARVATTHSFGDYHYYGS